MNKIRVFQYLQQNNGSFMEGESGVCFEYVKLYWVGKILKEF